MLTHTGSPFHGTYCTVLDAVALYNVFGQLEVVTTSLPEMADNIIATAL